MTTGEEMIAATTPVLWPRPVQAARFGPRPTLLSLEAGESERRAIAKAYGCISVDMLTADLKINRRGDALRVAGELRADLVQPCVVSLEPVPARIREQVSFVFAPPVPPRRDARADEPEEVAYEGEDPPEPLNDGQADLGAILLQFFALALDPYPRQTGVALATAPEEEGTHPFAALRGLKRDG
jgi:uncharacterized metal-binding protein YceD (DUF177 family)